MSATFEKKYMCQTDLTPSFQIKNRKLFTQKRLRVLIKLELLYLVAHFLWWNQWLQLSLSLSLVQYFYVVLVTDWTFGSAELLGQTSSVQFGLNGRTFFCRTQNIFLYYIQCQWHTFIFLFCLWPTCTQGYHWSLSKIAKRMPTEQKLE